MPVAKRHGARVSSLSGEFQGSRPSWTCFLMSIRFLYGATCTRTLALQHRMSSCTSEPVLRGLSTKLSLSCSPEAQLVPRQPAFLLFPEQQEFVSHLTQESFCPWMLAWEKQRSESKRDMLLGQLVLVLPKWMLGTTRGCRLGRQRKQWMILGARGGGNDDFRPAHIEIWIILSG